MTDIEKTLKELRARSFSWCQDAADEIEEQAEEIKFLEAEIERLKTGLSWYADPAHWTLTSPFTPDAEADQGEHARRVLSKVIRL